MLIYPYFANSILDNSQQIGIFLGTAIHDTSQVLGAAATYKVSLPLPLIPTLIGRGDLQGELPPHLSDRQPADSEGSSRQLCSKQRH